MMVPPTPPAIHASPTPASAATIAPRRATLLSELVAVERILEVFRAHVHITIKAPAPRRPRRPL